MLEYWQYLAETYGFLGLFGPFIIPAILCCIAMACLNECKITRIFFGTFGVILVLDCVFIASFSL